MSYTFAEYFKDASRTMTMDGDRDFHKMVAGLGLTGEAGEIASLVQDYPTEQEVAKETGDEFWYIAFTAYLYGVTLEKLSYFYENPSQYQAMVVLRQPESGINRVTIGLRIAQYAGEIADCIKKEVGHSHDPVPEKVIDSLRMLMEYCTLLVSFYQLNLDEVLQANIAKLKKRFPNGFSSEDSIKRVDVKNE